MKNRIAFIAALLGVAGTLIMNPQIGKTWTGDPQGAADSQSPLNDVVSYNGYGVNYTSYTVRITSGGHIIPGDQSGSADFGSPLHFWRNTYQFGMSVIKPGTPRNTSTIGVAIASAGISISPNSSYMELTSTGGAFTMSAKPNISTAGYTTGTMLYIYCATNSIVLQDKNTLAGSGLTLTTATLTLGLGDSAWFILGSSQNTWNIMGQVDVINP